MRARERNAKKESRRGRRKKNEEETAWEEHPAKRTLVWRARPRRNRYMEVFFWVLKVRHYIPVWRLNYVGAQRPSGFPALDRYRGPWELDICYAPTIATRRRTLRTNTAAEVMLASSSSTRNGRTQGQPRPAPAVPVMGASAQPPEPAAHHR